MEAGLSSISLFIGLINSGCDNLFKYSFTITLSLVSSFQLFICDICNDELSPLINALYPLDTIAFVSGSEEITYVAQLNAP